MRSHAGRRLTTRFSTKPYDACAQAPRRGWRRCALKDKGVFGRELDTLGVTET